MLDPRDGIYTYTDPDTNDILLASIEDGESEIFVRASDLKVGDGFLEVQSFEISQDSEYLLLRTNVTNQWRYSTHSNVYIYKLADKSLFPLNKFSTIDQVPVISYATWSPTGHKLAYVLGNEIFVTDLENLTRITFDGSNTIFNGVPDWVYEEEVFGTDYAMWWSPDSTHLAYLRFNETAVPEFHLQYYTATNDSYPSELTIKYPKAGSPNPLVTLHIHSLISGTTVMVTSNSTLNATVQMSDNFFELKDTDRIITDVIWSTETNTHLLFKQTNRVQDIEITNLVTLGTFLQNETVVETIRTYKPSDGGWIDPAQTMVYIPDNDTAIPQYLDIIDNGNGYMHLALLKATLDANDSPFWLTSGDWEVIPSTVEVDHERQLIHYISTERSYLERHLYRIDLRHPKDRLCLTCPDQEDVHAYFTASFSPKHGYYILQYDGPDIPTTVVKKVDDAAFEAVLQDNEALRSLLSNYELPRTRMVPVKSGGIDMMAMEVLPPDFSVSKKYPVLFHVYGGPGSQLASYRFELSWSTFLASKLGYIIVTVDGRGTGFKGRKYRSGVRGRLGELETIDQINAARHWATLEYVDPSRIAIWGWSYGGYMASKVIEANSGLFVAGMAVAPVTDWRFYDSIYTERYMLTPELNPQGYATSAISNTTGFENVRYLLIHGTGDDNVHFQNTAVLVDKLTQANNHNYRVQFFTDNNHAIRYHNANQNVYYTLSNFLWESFGGEEYLHVRKELNGHFSGPLLTGEH
ncbi:dipeptidyl peptidase IV N-terminal region-domain-containing protein [Cokeromyces recurvatus]|uniref:dipeptidyl peptidase IV N-terminal region-domain-containing protein n=1 Tax=Cokeromyces recurvatus TaxID=90255 RepID=UPI002220E438|nr:dipeptidyl peptidase IV N-terminal region-domain-containing protein [Cokeromyces recurvatus]KAI7905249.1 dipeptidyl peptidase IV N-terminal region-domain-containing protein [Cokeromyces recurvatus]